MAAGHEGMSGRLCVYVEGWLAAEPQRHVRSLRSTHGAFPLLALRLHLGLTAPSPAVVAVDMSTAQVRPWLLLVQDVLASQTGEGQSVEADGALWAAGVELLPQGLQVLDRGGAGEALCRTPQEGSTTEVYQGTVHQLVTLRIHHLPSMLSRSGLSQCEDITTDRYFPPHTRSGVLGKTLPRMHDQNTVCGQSVHLTTLHSPLSCLLPKEDVFGGVEACSVDSRRERRVPLADDATGKAGDCALNRLTIRKALPSRYSVCDHKVNGTLCGTTDLKHVCVDVMCVFHHYSMRPRQCV